MSAAGRLGFLSTRVGRRTLVQFLGAALLPVLAVSVAGVAVVHQSLDREARERAVRAVQAQSLLVLGALTAIGGDSAVVGEPRELTDATPKERNHLAAGEPLLRVTGPAGANAQGDALVSVWRRDTDGQARATPVGGPALWGTLDEITRGSTEAYCVFETGSWQRIHCAPNAGTTRVEAMRQAARTSGGESGVLRADGLVIAHRDIFLRAAFESPEWRFVSSNEEAIVFAPIATMVRTMLILAALAAVAAFAVAHRQIRRSTAPLAALGEAAHRVMGGDFETPVAITSDDEYGELGRTFDVMSSSLSRQFLLLRNMDAVDHASLAERRAEEIIAAALRATVAQHECLGASIALRGNKNAFALRVWTIDRGAAKIHMERAALPGAARHVVDRMPRIAFADLTDTATAPLRAVLQPPQGASSLLLLPLRQEQNVIGLMAVSLVC